MTHKCKKRSLPDRERNALLSVDSSAISSMTLIFVVISKKNVAVSAFFASEPIENVSLIVGGNLWG